MRLKQRPPTRASGFTLIEMAAVILIIGIMGTAVVVSLERITPRYRFRSEARNLANFMEAVRTEAIRSARHYTITYDIGTGRYWAEPQRTQNPETSQPKIHELPGSIAFDKIDLGSSSPPLGSRVTVSVSTHGSIAVHAVRLKEIGGIGRVCTVTFMGPGGKPLIEDGNVPLPEPDKIDEGLLRDRHEEYIQKTQ